jgi:transcriptional regulator with XRE-family HTH domain
MAPPWRRALGDELRSRRTAVGLTQAGLGSPLTRGFVSAVEHGRTMPSLPALAHMLARVDLTLAEFFERVEARMVDPDLTAGYDPRHGDLDDQETPPRGGRSA